MQYLFVFIAFFIFTTNAFAKDHYKRVALVIGNAKYQYSKPLKNPLNDAKRLAGMFEKNGFKVFFGKNLHQKKMQDMLAAFKAHAQKADIAVIYFSGHGIEIDGINYLLPIDFQQKKVSNVKYDAISLLTVMDEIGRRGKLRMVIIDACRNNPFKKRYLSQLRGVSRSVNDRGLTPVAVKGNLMIAYAAEGGTVASDGVGNNSPFAKGLLKHLFVPGLDIRLALGRVRDFVRDEMNGEQVPWYNGTLGGEIVSIVPPLPAPPPPDTGSIISDLQEKQKAFAKQKQELLTKINEKNEKIRKFEEEEKNNRLAADEQKKQAEKKRLAALAERKNLEEQLESLKSREVERGWSEVRAVNRLERYKQYAEKNPDSPYAREARFQVQQLSWLKKRWKQLEVSKNLLELNQFVKDAKGTEFEHIAVNQLNTLSSIEEKEWDAAALSGTRRAFNIFLEEWPEGLFAASAKSRIEEINKIEVEWKKLKANPTLEELEKFVKLHGGSEFGPEAIVLLADLKRRQNKSKSNVTALNGQALKKLINGVKVRMSLSDSYFYFNTELVPRYRARVGKKFLQKLLSQKLTAEGGFRAEYWNSKHKVPIEGIAGIVPSTVDNSATLYLMQMHGNEKSAADINDKDRKYATIQIIAGPQGYVCNGTKWHSILSTDDPAPMVDHCSIETGKK